ncbi:hypothetical protein LIER_39869 [Lithospermum erythrorhizon]|uniref:Protein kinase domain-containing protein n=1 Tax=Lithospermum erythrorhizon TaxID=34254 RepID=A0AAV3QMT9_LITER
MQNMQKGFCIFTLVLVSFLNIVCGLTDPGDAKVLNDFRNGIENPEVLKWPKGNDPCGPPQWQYVICSKGKVTQIQTKNLGLKGTLPGNFNKLDKLENVGLQNNFLHGTLPSFSGLSNLQFAYLGNNSFETMPSDFFNGLSSVRVLSLDNNPFNKSSGWSLPSAVGELSQLMNFSCSSCNIVGHIPDYFGELKSLSTLKLGYNRLSGEIPSAFNNSMLQVLWLNNQDGGGLSGSIDVIGSMVGLTSLWLHGNQFSGPLPDNIGTLTSLNDLNLNGNKFVGTIPPGLANMNLKMLNLNNNMFMGSIPYFKAASASFDYNSFCQPRPGDKCAPQVNALLDFLHDIGYPPILASEWTGNDPCKGRWRGISCSPDGKVTVINLQKLNLNGTLSPSLVYLDSLLEVYLGGNNLHGKIPANLSELKNLKLLDLTGNSFEPPIPNFSSSTKLIVNGNSKITGVGASSDSNGSSGGGGGDGDGDGSSTSSSGSFLGSPRSYPEDAKNHSGSKARLILLLTGSALAVVIGLFLVFLIVKRKKSNKKDAADVKFSSRDVYTHPTSGNRLGEGSSSLDNGNLACSAQVLREVTNNFAEENELGRGGFGAVYKGELVNGTQIAVKRMEAGVISSKALDEFEAEITVLSEVRHRHLVSLLGFAVEGNERLLVYEYMPEGALSRYLFKWKSLHLEPLSWRKRLIIALDVARGMEYLHSMAHQSFIHRDLKSANILLSDDFRAKVADFGLVKLAPDAERSLCTRLAGTFGYLAPEYAATGKITTKVDVFSYGVVLIELLTGLIALDDQRSEESRYLAEWFWKMKLDKQKLLAALDPVLAVKEDSYDSIFTIAELAAHCTTKDPNNRPEMGYAVNVLSLQVEKWYPGEEPVQDQSYKPPDLRDMLKLWQETDTKNFSLINEDSRGSIATKFTSTDAR